MPVQYDTVWGEGVLRRNGKYENPCTQSADMNVFPLECESIRDTLGVIRPRF